MYRVPPLTVLFPSIGNIALYTLKSLTFIIEYIDLELPLKLHRYINRRLIGVKKR